MSNTPTELRYCKTHEWARQADDGTVVVGISDFAQDALGDVVFVELPNIGTTVDEGDELAVVESVKAASDIYAPVAGTVVDVNEELDENPDLVNSDPYGDGWFFTLDPLDPEAINELLTAEDYEDVCLSED